LSNAEAEREILKNRLAAAEKRGQGLRAANECLIEALIQATIRIANIEAELRLTDHERETLSSQLADKTLQFEAILQSSSWRITRPMRRVVKIFSERKTW
jgi:hypothetical protein